MTLHYTEAEEAQMRLAVRSKRCTFCDRPQVYEVAVTLEARCDHSPHGACRSHLTRAVQYALECPDADHYVLVGRVAQ